MSDYLELPLYLNEDVEAKTTDLWVYTDPNKFFIVKGVNGDPIRYNGWWTIPFIQYNRYASVHVEASKVMYFVSIDNSEVEYD
jgi:hypothetical protein